MKNIMVTGGAGYIGSHIVELLVKKNFKVLIIDDLSTGHKRLINKKAKFIKCNVNQTFLIKKIIKENKIDSVIHLAAKTNVAEAQKKAKFYYKNNIYGTLSLLKACLKSNIKNFVFSSTCAVYENKLFYVNEKSKRKPRGIYGYTKMIGENLIKKYLNKKKKNYAILRYFNVVGSSSSKKIGQINKDDQLFKNFSLESKKKKAVFNIYGYDYKTFDGTCVRDFIHVSDLAEIHIKVLSKINNFNRSIILNCGYGKGWSVLEVANQFNYFTRNKAKINFQERRKGDIVEMVANISKLKRILKWKPKFFDLKKMVKSSIEWEKKLNNY